MRTSGAIVAVGLLALAVAAAVAGWGPHGPERGRRRALAEAESVVREFLAASAAVYDTGGDPRAAERVPAAPDVVGEMIGDIAFAQHRLDAREWRRLVRVEIVASRWLPGGDVEVRTREFWIFKRGPLRGGAPEGPATSAVSNVRYELAREAGTWRVLSYRLDAAASAGEGR